GGQARQVVSDALFRLGLRLGYRIDVAASACDGAISIRSATAVPADFVVLNPWTTALLAPVWDHYHRLTQDELDERIRALRHGVGVYLNEFLHGLNGKLGMVHGLT